MKFEIKEEVKRHIESVAITDKDLVLLRGDWDYDMVQEMSKQLSDLAIHTLIIVMPDDRMDFSKMPISTFYDIMKATEKCLGLNAELYEDDGVIGD